VKYGRIAENASINAAIYRCFEYVSEPDAQTFARAFGRLPHDGDQIMHVFRELILGGFLASRGQRVAYDQRVNGQTPDWSIVEEDHRLRCIGDRGRPVRSGRQSGEALRGCKPKIAGAIGDRHHNLSAR
jgi:hypothetical protein